MERLQAAIEKAREQREGAHSPNAKTNASGQPHSSRSGGEERPELNDLWMALTAMELPQRQRLSQNRVMTVQAGVESAPFDLLRTRMLQQAKKNDWKRIGFVSPHSACGKSTTVANLAFSLARQTDTRTIALDFDLRRQGLSRLLEQKPKSNLWDVLEGKIPFSDHGVRHGSNVAFGCNSAVTPNASEILQSSKTADILKEIEDTYEPDIMLFDLPPLMASDDNFGFLNKVDAALILVAAEKTSMSQIDVSERQVAELTTVMGVVLNQCRYMSGAYGHEYHYYRE